MKPFLILGKMECMLRHRKHDEKQCLILGELCLAGKARLYFVVSLTCDQIFVKSTNIYLNFILVIPKTSRDLEIVLCCITHTVHCNVCNFNYK
jgi:hypothetical protein